MPRPFSKNSERRERQEKFQTFSRPKVKVTRVSASGKTYVDYKDTESLRRMLSGNGKILSRKRTGVSAMEQRMVAAAVKRSRYMALLPYVSMAF
ncbi:MAG: 30S ribosomal protein S18 [Bacillota bacterium]